MKNAFAAADLGGRPVKIQTVAAVEDLSECDLVFVSPEEKDRVLRVVQWAEKNGALTVGDSEGFGERGLIVNFFLQDDKVRFEINKAEADRAGFRISSLLLKVAKIVGGK